MISAHKKTIANSLPPEHIAYKPHRDNVLAFEENLLQLWRKINQNKESEEHYKNIMTHFLKETTFKSDLYDINTKGRIDLAIKEKGEEEPVKVIFECKRQENKAEMISIQDINKKAFQELVYYFLNERIGNKNIHLKHLIITNVKEWFIFDAEDFEKIFNKKELVKDYKSFQNGELIGSNTDFFYTQIAKDYIEAKAKNIPVTYINLADYVSNEGVAFSDSEKSNEKLINLYKILSPEFLLKQNIGNDANELNQQFYQELLHIMGLEERKVDNKNIIKRKEEEERERGSLMEMTLVELKDKGIFDVENRENYGSNQEEQIFGIALDLCTTWINRILFLKLLEGQLCNYNQSNKYKFLNTERIATFKELSILFHKVLAVKPNERDTYKSAYKDIPYLNSSLFDYTALERKLININDLDSALELAIHKHSVLFNNKQQGKVNKTLAYLLDFLNCYDFGSEDNGELTQENNKALINASVLGKVFEKINGYKDGSIYTPSFITMYMANESIIRAVAEKFNQSFEWNLNLNDSAKDLAIELENQVLVRLNNTGLKVKANEAINSIKICDPAVGSGHLLVSALNEIIALKSTLNLLMDEDNKLIPYKVRVVNDELLVYNEDDETGAFNIFKYRPQSTSSRRIQKTLFQEKRKIIEKCLFGVDLNPNSVKICRLRLWIELLKNAYYSKEEGFKDADNPHGYLETLPNIDINIKNGDALLSRFTLSGDIRNAFKKSKWTIATYRITLQAYREARTNEDKRELLQLISNIKNDIRVEVDKNNKHKVELKKTEGELINLLDQKSMFETEAEEKKRIKKQEELEKKISKISEAIEAIEENKAYTNAFEWRFEFPEVLDDEGNFVGFDIMIANPPYIQLQKMGEQSKTLANQAIPFKSYAATGDIYCLFYEQALKLLKPKGILCFITSNKWMRAGYGERLRNLLVGAPIDEKDKLECLPSNPIVLIDFAGSKVFDNATVDVNILLATKENYKGETFASIFNGDKKSLKEMLFFQANNLHTLDFKPNQPWTILSPIELSIKAKIEALGTPLKDWDVNIYRGVLTGYNEAFIIDEATKDRLISEDANSAEIIRPILRGRDIKKYSADFAGLYLIATFPTLKIDIEKYPAVKNHLLSFGFERLEQSGKPGARKKTNNQWFETQDSISYWNDFYKEKIVYPETTQGAYFVFDKDNFFIDKTCFMIISNNAQYLLGILSSKLFEVTYKSIFSSIELGINGYQYNKHALLKLPIIKPKGSYEVDIINMINNKSYKDIDKYVYDIYNLSKEEIQFIENQ